MDEILIEEKKYVSSKRAAQITGYAKDYIGQLCREGRVSARLVGRSWYVLESAIQDHRFGVENNNRDITPVIDPPVQDKWEAPHYQAEESVDTTIPPINRLTVEDLSEESRSLHDSWKTWFEHFDSTPEGERSVSPAKEVVPLEEPEESKEAPEVINVPLHVLSRQYPPKELLPRSIDVVQKKIEDSEEESASLVEELSTHTGSIESIYFHTGRQLQAIGIFVAILCAVLASINTGILDKILVSYSQVSFLSGLSVYSK
jgi:hypothetical protein